MFSSPTPAPGSRSIAANALRNAGLIDRDSAMRDVSDKPGGRKGSSKMRSHRDTTAELLGRNKSGSSSSRMLTDRLSTSHAGPSDPLSIRGAARPTMVGRIRRNAVSSSGGTKAPIEPVTRVKIRSSAIDLWREFVRKRWNPETRYLNLDSMVEDEFVKKNHLMPPGYGGSPRDAAVIFKLASQLTPEVQTLSLANNNLSGIHLSHLSRYLPRLANLSLQNNNIRLWKDLDAISARKEKLVHLRELILLGNPVRDLEFQNGRGERYKSEIARRFSSLEVLDQEAIAQISFDVPQPSTSTTVVQTPTASTFPYEMGPSFVTGVDGALVSNFLSRFFNIFDTRRAALLNVYDPAATFSYSVNTTIPTRARILGFHNSREMPNQRKLEWTPWLSGVAGGSRNLSRMGGGVDKTVKSLHIGADEAIKALQALPGTRHDISGPPEKFCVDSFPVAHGQGTGLLLVIHGEFVEVGTEGVRSFDRTFILAPASDGSRAKLNGWDVVILSDQWTIRGYSSHEAWKPGPMLVQAQIRSSAANLSSDNKFQAESLPQEQQTALASIPELQRSLILQVCARTRLNVKFSYDCLAGNAWDLDRAIANFNQVKGTLPKEAFF